MTIQIDFGGLCCAVAAKWDPGDVERVDVLFVNAAAAKLDDVVPDLCPHDVTLTFWDQKEREPDEEYAPETLILSSSSWSFTGRQYEKKDAVSYLPFLKGCQSPGLGTLGLWSVGGRVVLLRGITPDKLKPSLYDVLDLDADASGRRVDVGRRAEDPTASGLLSCRIVLDSGFLSGVSPSPEFDLEAIGRPTTVVPRKQYSSTIRYSAELVDEDAGLEVLAIDFVNHNCQQVVFGGEIALGLASLCAPEKGREYSGSPEEKRSAAKKANDVAAVYEFGKLSTEFDDRLVPIPPKAASSDTALGKPWCPPLVGLWA